MVIIRTPVIMVSEICGVTKICGTLFYYFENFVCNEFVSENKYMEVDHDGGPRHRTLLPNDHSHPRYTDDWTPQMREQLYSELLAGVSELRLQNEDCLIRHCHVAQLEIICKPKNARHGRVLVRRLPGEKSVLNKTYTSQYQLVEHMLRVDSLADVGIDCPEFVGLLEELGRRVLGFVGLLE